MDLSGLFIIFNSCGHLSVEIGQIRLRYDFGLKDECVIGIVLQVFARSYGNIGHIIML